MNARWYVAKYMSDLRRREPQNVGILLFTDGGVETRFRGESGAKVDGRLVRGTFGSLETYKAWIACWKAVAAKNDLAGLIGRRPTDNYFVELGGERILGSDSVDPTKFADQLFRELVEDRAEPLSNVMLGMDMPVARRAFTRLEIVEKITEAPPIVSEVDGVVDPLYFNYRYQNGISALMKEIHLGRDESVTHERLHSAAWTFGQARRLEVDSRIIALVDWAEGADTNGAIAFLQATRATVVDMSSEEEAAKGLAKALDLKPSILLP